MQLAAQHCDMPIPTPSEVKHIIGISLLPAIKQLFGLTDSLGEHKKAEQLRDAYKQAFIEKDQTPSPLFSGVIELLDDLNALSIDLAVATGKARRGLERAWLQTQTKHYFVNSRTADEAESKPSPDMLIQLLNDQNVHAHKAIMIGDTSYDMQMAREIGMDSIAVTYGVHDRQHLREQSPTHTVDSIKDLRQTLLTTLS